MWNLTVADQPEYYADGVLVHNCDTMRYVVAELDLVGTSNVQSPARRGQTGGRVPRGAQRYGRSIGGSASGGGSGRGRR